MLSASKIIISGIFRKIGMNQYCLGISSLDLRLSTLGLLLIFNFSFFTFNSCGLDVEDSTPPSPPVWVQKSLPEEWPEHGIDAHESGGIYLEWEPNLDEDIVAYNIYRATWYDVNDSLGDFELLIRLDIESKLSREYVDIQAIAGSIYFYKLACEDASDNSSEFSDSLYYSLLPQLNAKQMNPNGSTIQLGSSRSLSWSYTYSIEMEEYNITVLTEYGELLIREIMLPADYTGGSESWQVPDSVILEPGRMYQWRIDTGARYVGGHETAGSESAWATFLYADD